jgi:cytoskeletal protein CcmA (bactofilin family)
MASSAPNIQGKAGARPGDPSQDTLVIEPVKMNLVNRVAAGAALRGDFQFKGGLLLQGELRGRGDIAGRLVVWPGGRLVGNFKVNGDMYVLGNLGDAVAGVDLATLVDCIGTAYIASTGVSTGHIVAARLRMYDGAILQGPFSTLRPEQAPPVLQPDTSR